MYSAEIMKDIVILFLHDNVLTGHGDLILKLKKINFLQKADTYYFLLENELFPNLKGKKKSIMVMITLLEKWMMALKSMSSQDIVLLPFDFSDQYVGGLMVRKKGEQYKIRYCIEVYDYMGNNSEEFFPYFTKSVTDFLFIDATEKKLFWEKFHQNVRYITSEVDIDEQSCLNDINVAINCLKEEVF